MNVLSRPVRNNEVGLDTIISLQRGRNGNHVEISGGAVPFGAGENGEVL